MQESCTASSCHVMRKRLLRRAGNSWSVASSQFRSVSSSNNAANLPPSPVVLCPALDVSESAIVRSNASNTSDLTGGATSVAISGSSVWACSPPVLQRSWPNNQRRTCGCHSEVLPRPCVALGSVPCVCLHPQQTTLDGCCRHLTHSCTGPTGSHALDLVVGPNCPQSPPLRNCPQLCHRRCNHPRQEKKEAHADRTGPCTCGACEKGLDVMPLQS